MLETNKKLENLNRDELLATVRQLLAEADALSSRIAVVNEIGITINETLDINKVMKFVAKRAKWLLDFEHLSICLQHGDDWTLEVMFGKEPIDFTDWLDTSNVGYVLRTSQAKLIQNGIDSPFLSGYQSQMIIPLASSGRQFGTINFAIRQAEQYTQDDMRIAYMLSLQISSALRNATIVQELESTQEELRLRVEDLDAYNHTIAHDLKSPLSNILLSSDLVNLHLPDDTPQKATNFIESIRLSAVQMNKMIDQLLLLAKLRHFDDVTEEVYVADVVQNALFRFVHVIDEHKIKIHVVDDLPNAIGHEQWVEEVFANLISNAVKYMGDDNPNPSITIQAKTEDRMIRYEVRDTGIGIKPEDLNRLFEMFTRVGDTKADGLGLGLSIIQRIINRLGGRLGVESVFGEGSTFWFTLPHSPEPQNQPENPMPSQYKAVVIDDDPQLALAFEGALEASGYDVTVVNDSRLALTAIRETIPLIITLDMQMPHVSGVDILEAIRADDDLKHIKIIMITADTQVHRFENVINQADLILSKPITLSQLKTFIERVTDETSKDT